MAQTLKPSVRQSILVAAAQVFSSHPWAHATMQQVARAAGLSVGNLYRYFPGKREILAAILTPSVFADIRTAVLQSLQSLAEAALEPDLARELPPNTSQAQTLATYRQELLILFQDLEGTPWAGFPEGLRQELGLAFANWMSRRGFPATPLWYSRMDRLYEGLIRHAILLFREFEEAPVLEQELKVLIAYHVAGMIGLSKEWENDEDGDFLVLRHGEQPERGKGDR